MDSTVYGLHLTLRLAKIEMRSKLEGAENISALLAELVQRIGMRVLAGPLVGEERSDLMNSGWSGVVILVESHAAIHTYPARGEAFLDVFSCGIFEEAQVIQFFHENLGDFVVVECNTTQRGIHWGTNVNVEMAAWKRTR